ncbi:MAG TPA: type II toxin-antitoxin system VapC family toxin [Vicinamibacterales bacterium]|nr:type II toxin-antitoxin system VapC family toxin [Vicinamibacterales bacterium]
MKTLFDTNILIDYLAGVAEAQTEIERARERLISIVTWMELLAGARSEEEEDVLEMFLSDFRVVDVTRRIAREATAFRKTQRIHLLDAIIWASARHESALLVTRNTKDFQPDDCGVRVPYAVTKTAPPRRKASGRRRASR